MAIREYSFKGWDLCGSLTLQPVTSYSAYRNRVCVHMTSLGLTVRKTSPIYTKKNRSCEDAVQSLVDYVVSQLDQKRKCLTVFIDLSKAFDCVNHYHLLKKLELFGFRSNFLCFLK